MAQMRLDKYICDMTDYTRSTVKTILKDKRVRVNGTIVKDSGYKLKENDTVTIDDEEIKYV